MGSFCYTCALSELPIQSGAAVWLVPLCQRGGGLNDGAWGAYKMAFPPIRAEYDEYGGVENPKIKRCTKPARPVWDMPAPRSSLRL